jgi:hypothetical protein
LFWFGSGESRNENSGKIPALARSEGFLTSILHHLLGGEKPYQVYLMDFLAAT